MFVHNGSDVYGPLQAHVYDPNESKGFILNRCTLSLNSSVQEDWLEFANNGRYGPNHMWLLFPAVTCFARRKWRKPYYQHNCDYSLWASNSADQDKKINGDYRIIVIICNRSSCSIITFTLLNGIMKNPSSRIEFWELYSRGSPSYTYVPSWVPMEAYTSIRGAIDWKDKLKFNYTKQNSCQI